MKDIFISYRQDDAKPWAFMLAQDLVETFGAENVFLDKDTLHAGSWRDQIQQALDCSKVVLVVIGRKWVSITDESGRRRLDDPADIHRQEVASALLRKDVTVIPVRVDGAPVPRSAELPEAIRILTEQQSRELSDNSARRTVDLAQLIGDIEMATGLIAKKPPGELSLDNVPAAKSSRVPTRLLVTAAAISIVVLVFADLVLGWSLEAGEKAFLASIVFVATLGIARLYRRSAGEQR